MHHHLGNAGDQCADHGQAACHRFGDDGGQDVRSTDGIKDASQREQVALRQLALHVLLRTHAEQRHGVGHVFLGDARLQLGPHWAIADDADVHRHTLLLQQARRADQMLEALELDQAPDTHDAQGLAVTHGHSGEIIDLDAVEDPHDLVLAVRALFAKQAAGELADRDDEL